MTPPVTTPTAEELALARKIVKQFYPEMPDSYSGRRLQIALSAIQQTTELAAKLVENPDRSGREWVKDSLWGNISTDLSDALRRNGHLKQEAV